MPMHVNEDYLDMLSALNDAEAEYLVVGAYALGAHGNPRATGDIDLWVRPTPENARCVWRAYTQFAPPSSDVSEVDFAQRDVVVRIGQPPRCIDLLTSIAGVEFEEAWRARVVTKLGDVPVAVIARKHLLANKRAAGRAKDLADAEWLEATDNWDS